MRAWIFFMFLGWAQADSIKWEGHFQPAQALVKVHGTGSVVRDSFGDWVILSSDFRVSSGVILDLEVCGIPTEGLSEVCVHIQELRKLVGPQKSKIAIPLFSYSRVRIFDVDLGAEHAVAALNL